ncbi:MAG: trypsin-like peptidase domain-containing protein [Lachnospiraceae bacterium]|nr:trypsin-like peptidase domain-containing protein [Lachnospiraceae bacterium]
MDYQYGNNDNNENENRDVNSIPENNTGSAPEPERKKSWNEEWENNTPAQNSNPYINTGYQSGNRNPYENGSYRGTGSTGSYQTGNGSYPYGTGSSYGSSYQNNSYQNNSYQNSSYQGSGYNGGGNGQGPKKKKKGGAALIALGMAAVLFVGAGLGVYGSQVWNRISTNPGLQEQQPETAGEESTTEESKAGLQQAQNTEESVAAESVATTTTSSSNMTVQQIAENCLPSIVAITNKGVAEIQSIWGTYTTESESAGSGVIIGETDTELLIITNYHVVEGNQTLSVVFSFQENEEDPEVVSAKVKDYDSSKDLAVISINKEDLSSDVLSNIRVAVVGNSEDLALGEQVVAIGNALGYGQSVTTGIVSALNRTVNLQSEDGSVITNKYIQTDASINPGNSGGGLFNMKGELVGINSAKVASAEVEGMGYSIPISDVSGDIEVMMNAETREVVAVENRGYLGITGSNVTSDVAASYGLPMGVYISGVTAGSPAEAYGLAKGMVVTGINGKTINTIEALKTYLSYYAIGEEVTITAMVQSNDGYVEKTFDIVLGSAEQAGIQSNTGSTQNEQNGQNGQNGNNGSNGGNYYNNGNYGSMDPEDLYNYFFGGGR